MRSNTKGVIRRTISTIRRFALIIHRAVLFDTYSSAAGGMERDDGSICSTFGDSCINLFASFLGSGGNSR